MVGRETMIISLYKPLYYSIVYCTLLLSYYYDVESIYNSRRTRVRIVIIVGREYTMNEVTHRGSARGDEATKTKQFSSAQNLLI